MDSQSWKKPERKSKIQERRVLDCEEFDSADRWMRDCRVRSDSWFTIEAWARENGFHMVAYKAKKRLYQKGMAPDAFIYFLEVRHEERRVVLKSWIEVSRKAQWLSLFHLPAELKLDPLGFWGVRQRRRLCEQVNQLLIHLKQPEIADSHIFHWADLDQSTLGLLGVLSLPFILFFLSLVGKVEIAPGLSNSLMTLIGEKLVWLWGAGITGLILHHWLVVKKLRRSWANWASFGLQTLVFVAVTVFLFTRTSQEIRDQKIVYHCVSHYQVNKCQREFSKMSDIEKTKLGKRLEALQKQIAIKSP